MVIVEQNRFLRAPWACPGGRRSWMLGCVDWLSMASKRLSTTASTGRRTWVTKSILIYFWLGSTEGQSKPRS